jgi:hypothetical protein
MEHGSAKDSVEEVLRVPANRSVMGAQHEPSFARLEIYDRCRIKNRVHRRASVVVSSPWTLCLDIDVPFQARDEEGAAQLVLLSTAIHLANSSPVVLCVEGYWDIQIL